MISVKTELSRPKWGRDSDIPLITPILGQLVRRDAMRAIESFSWHDIGCIIRMKLRDTY